MKLPLGAERLRLAWHLVLVAGIALLGTDCSGHAATDAVVQYAASEPPSGNPASTVKPHAVRMLLRNGEVVTIQPAAQPSNVLPNQVPAAILSAVRSHKALSTGRFRSVVENDGTSWAAHLPRPAGGAGSAVTPTRTSTSHADSATGSGPDHSTDGWYVDGYESNPNYESEGYIQFSADLGIPTLYPGSAGGPGYNVYYAPATQGTNGNPLEVGLATEPNWPYAGSQHLFIFDWSNPNGNTPCDQDGYPDCVGFASYAPIVDSRFTSKYVRVLSHGAPEWSISTFQFGGYWYFSIYNYNTGQWEYPYATHYTEIRHNFQTRRNGVGGGHGYFEYWLPAGTACAATDHSNAAVPNIYESDAQQYSAITNSWTRVSAEKYMHSGILGGNGACFVGPNMPYINVSNFDDGWSNWAATGE